MNKIVDRVKDFFWNEVHDFHISDIIYILKHLSNICEQESITLDEMYNILKQYGQEFPEDIEYEDDDWDYCCL